MSGTTDTAVLTLRSATFGYAGRPVVGPVDLTVARGEVVALLGANGSGKSTLVRGLMGLNDHLGGTVEVLGSPLSSGRARSHVGYVPQHHSLDSAVRATVREVVEVGRLPHRRWWRPIRAVDRELVHQALVSVGMADRAGDDVGALSGGQQRRVLIARALAGQPSVLVMDEPTAGVDRGNQEALTRTLATLASADDTRETTMVVVTHELAAIEPIVTRVVCLDAGHVDFDGTPAAYAAHAGVHPVGADHHGHDHTHAPSTPVGVTTSAGPLDTPRGARRV